MQRLTYVVFITTTEKDSASRRQPCVLPAQLAISLVHQSRSQTNDCGLWSWNEKMCPHAYKIRKWRPTRRTLQHQRRLDIVCSHT